MKLITSAIFLKVLNGRESHDGGCKATLPKPVLDPNNCDCNANPTISKYVVCVGESPGYIDSMDDLPNGACIMYIDGKRDGTSLGICEKDVDCAGDLICGPEFLCQDEKGILESDRIVQSCVSPKGTARAGAYMMYSFIKHKSI